MRLKLDLNNRYETICQVASSPGGERQNIGTAGSCRFCNSGQPTFENKAHTFPEALGNRRIFSLDECDDCNFLFSVYESSLVDSVKPFLTLGGVKGKRGIPQSGRTASKSYVRGRKDENGRRIFWQIQAENPDQVFRVHPETKIIHARLPVPSVPFVPRMAYKALVKMAFALLPENELPSYGLLREWLQTPKDELDFSTLDVLMSFGEVGNAPPVISGALLRRTNPNDVIPHIQFLFSAGSICFQIDLMSDHLEDHIELVPRGAVKIRWNPVFSEEEGSPSLQRRYTEPHLLDWASNNSEPQPIESIDLEFNPRSCNGKLSPNFRELG